MSSPTSADQENFKKKRRSRKKHEGEGRKEKRSDNEQDEGNYFKKVCSYMIIFYRKTRR
jgi:hypothetical protein